MHVSVSNGEHGRFLSIQAQDFIEERTTASFYVASDAYS